MTPDLVARIAPLAPCYVYEQSLIRESLSKLRRAFASCRFLYSVKANPFAAVLREAALAGFGTDAASAEEVRLSLEAGIEPDEIYYSAPGKTPQDILNTDVEDVFKQLGLDSHLSPTRRNGFFAMVERVKSQASKALS